MCGEGPGFRLLPNVFCKINDVYRIHSWMSLKGQIAKEVSKCLFPVSVLFFLSGTSKHWTDQEWSSDFIWRIALDIVSNVIKCQNSKPIPYNVFSHVQQPNSLLLQGHTTYARLPCIPNSKTQVLSICSSYFQQDIQCSSENLIF